MGESLKGTLQAGVGKCNITPPAYYLAAGGFEEDLIREIKEEFWVQAMVLSVGDEKLAIVSCDLTLISNELIDEMRSLILEWTGIPREATIISATHVHGAPVTFPSCAGEPDEAYLKLLVRKVATAVLTACQNLRPAKLGASSGYEDSVAFNRRLRFPDGTVRMNFSLTKNRAYPEATPLGPIDPELSVLRVDDVSGRPIGALINYACHNIPNFASLIGTYMGRILDCPDFMGIFLPGACGNVNYINHLEPNQGTSAQELFRISRILACEAARTHQRIVTSTIDDVEYTKIILEIPERGFTKADEVPGKAQEEVFIKERKKVREKGIDTIHQVEVMATRLGNSIGIVSNPGQLFAEHGLEIKSKSPFEKTFVLCLTNGNCGYVPTRESFDEGGYEPLRTSHSSFLSVDAGERIVDTSVALLKEIYRD